MAQLSSYPKFQAFDNSGNLLSGGLVYTYVSGTTTPATTYTDNGGLTPNANPVVLDSRGEANIWLSPNNAYTYKICDANNVLINTINNIIGVFNPLSSGFAMGGNLQIGNFSITDNNGVAYIDFNTATSAVNRFKIQNAASGTGPALTVVGTDANINWGLVPKGTGSVSIQDSSSNKIIDTIKVASAVNYVTVSNNATATAPIIAAAGTDTNISIALTPKGTGSLQLTAPISDSTNAAYLKWATVASAVNQITVGNAATGNLPFLQATGSDSNIGMAFVDSNSKAIATLKSIASAVNGITITNSITAVAPTISASGSDTNIGISLAPKGTAYVATTVGPPNADNSLNLATTAWVTANAQGIYQGGRLTLTTGTPVTTANVTGVSTIYYTPYINNLISIYSGSGNVWNTIAFTETTLAVPAVASKMYDIFAQNSAGTLVLVAVAWTNDTTRATALAYQNGTLCESGTLTNRYLGSFRTDSSNHANDSTGLRNLFNYYNHVHKQLLRNESASSWTYTTAAYRQVNANTANQVNFVTGIAENRVYCMASGAASNTAAGGGCGLAIVPALNSTSSAASTDIVCVSAVASNTSAQAAFGIFDAVPPIGYNYIAWLEASSATNTTTFYGVGAINTITGNNGLSGSLLC